MNRDLVERNDGKELIRAFYSSAFTDPLIGPIFTDVAKMDLEHHLPVMCDFWETVLFNANVYHRNTLQMHYALHKRHPLVGSIHRRMQGRSGSDFETLHYRDAVGE